MSENFTPKYWPERAEESRLIAVSIQDPVAKRIMIDVAESYDGMAARAEAQLRQARRKE
jgi:hypothetical protein